MPIEAVEAVEEEINELFPPKPGGLVDRFRRKAAEEEARRDEERNIAEKIEQPSYRAVKVAQQQPEVFNGIDYSIPAGGSAMVLPLAPYRFRATIAATAAPQLLLSTVVSGSATDPGAAANITTYTPVFPAGTYTVSATVFLSGTVTAADASNMEIYAGSVAVPITYPGVANVPVTMSVTITTTAPTNMAVLARTAASGAAAVYNASLTITPASDGGVILCKDQGAATSLQGFPLNAGGAPYVAQGRGQLWAANPGSYPVTVSVLSEHYAPETL